MNNWNININKIIGFVSDNASTVASPLNGVCGKFK